MEPAGQVVTVTDPTPCSVDQVAAVLDGGAGRWRGRRLAGMDQGLRRDYVRHPTQEEEQARQWPRPKRRDLAVHGSQGAKVSHDRSEVCVA